MKNSVSSILITSKNKYGQYFTPKLVAEFMVELTTVPCSASVLEPSAGEGIFLDVLQESGFEDITAYEIDETLISPFNFVRYESFVSAKINKKYDLIIGNPPYIRWKNLEPELKEELTQNQLWNTYFNSLCDYLYIFILKSIRLLNENGELIFVCPEYWLNTTHSLPLRNFMVENGYFEKIYHFNETPIFENASVSVIIFKYIKSKTKKKTIEVSKYYKNKIVTEEILSDLKTGNTENPDIEKIEVAQFRKNERWLLANPNELGQIEEFEKLCSDKIESKQDLFGEETLLSFPTIGEICDIGNGMVSGLDKAFQLSSEKKINQNEKKNTIQVVKAKDLSPFSYTRITNYIFVDDIETEEELEANCPNFYQKLIPYKEKLQKRYQYNRKINYWEWVFLRNYNLFCSSKERVFVPCKERISNKNYFRFAYVSEGIFPTQDVTAIFPKDNTKESIFYILAFLNNPRVFIWLKNKGIVKGNIVEFSEQPISSIPFRKINWSDEKEISLHNEITKITKDYIQQKEAPKLQKINELFDELLETKKTK